MGRVAGRSFLQIVACALVALAYLGVAQCQGPAATTSASSAAISRAAAFTVATVKPTYPETDQSDMGFNAGGALQARGITLKELIQLAYNLGYLGVDERMAGGPKWMATVHFDIEAKCDDALAQSFAKMPIKDQIATEQAMIRELLIERFNLRLHHETRELPVLTLVRTHEEPSLIASADDGPYEPFGPDGGPGNWKARGVSMEELASSLSALPEAEGRIVVDHTNLKGNFDFKLSWTPEPAGDAAAPDAGTKQDTAASSPSLLSALEEQLGLKLAASKEPVDVLVIDSANPPSQN
jgi:uncharacterized protein (TIGR03435 family)